MISKKFLILLFVIPLLFADIGPSPPSPEISVLLELEGNPFTEDIPLEYHCSQNHEVSGSIIGQRTVPFSCSEGACTSEGWFYKLNPCFEDNAGYFTYIYNNKTYTTEPFGVSSGGVYEFTIDVSTGSFTKKSSLVCPFALAVVLLALFGRFV
ncbi:hypothetical protein JXB01_03510 [Candidatus Micrarchaeota archaeon]|nr:hypothetical protein [Candidatus Micrarchaeota archaeon]